MEDLHSLYNLDTAYWLCMQVEQNRASIAGFYLPLNLNIVRLKVVKFSCERYLIFKQIKTIIFVIFNNIVIS